MIKLKKGDIIIIRRRHLDSDGFNVWTRVETTEVVSDFASVKLTQNGAKVVKGILCNSSFYVFPQGHSCPLCENGKIKYINYCDEKYIRDYKLHNKDDED